MDMLETYRIWAENFSDKDMAKSFERKINKPEVVKLIKRVDDLERWIAGIADDHGQIPDWIQQSARSLLAQEGE